MRFTKRETATVLAALRYWQNDLDDPTLTAGFDGFFVGTSRLDAEEIDILAERINFDTRRDPEAQPPVLHPTGSKR